MVWTAESASAESEGRRPRTLIIAGLGAIASAALLIGGGWRQLDFTSEAVGVRDWAGEKRRRRLGGGAHSDWTHPGHAGRTWRFDIWTDKTGEALHWLRARSEVGGNLEGGTSSFSGRIFVDALGAVTVGGSIIGGAGQDTGEIFSRNSIGLVKIGGSIVGGTNTFSGVLGAAKMIAGITVGGSLVGGTEVTAAGQNHLGAIFADGAIGPVKIGGNIQGGDVSSAVTVFDSGAIKAGRIASVFVGGSILGGNASGGGSLVNSGSIHAADDIGAITIKGSMRRSAPGGDHRREVRRRPARRPT